MDVDLDLDLDLDLNAVVVAVVSVDDSSCGPGGVYGHDSVSD